MADPFIGEIRMFAGDFAPRNWSFCDGALLPISSNTALFSLLGTTYGGDGRTTFALPDLRGRLPLHPGSGPGLSTRHLGQRGGTEDETLTANQIPSHTHSMQASSNLGNAPSPSTRVTAMSSSFDAFIDETPGGAALATEAVATAGGSQPHTNLQPYLCINFIIALQGIFPSRS